jgi:hypothetical protein
MAADAISSGSGNNDGSIHRTQETTIPTRGPYVAKEKPETADLQELMARGGVEPPTPRFSVKNQEPKIWPWLQGLS